MTGSEWVVDYFKTTLTFNKALMEASIKLSRKKKKFIRRGLKKSTKGIARLLKTLEK